MLNFDWVTDAIQNQPSSRYTNTLEAVQVRQYPANKLTTITAGYNEKLDARIALAFGLSLDRRPTVVVATEWPDGGCTLTYFRPDDIISFTLNVQEKQDAPPQEEGDEQLLIPFPKQRQEPEPEQEIDPDDPNDPANKPPKPRPDFLKVVTPT